MKLIDRYLLRRLLTPLFWCLAAFSLVYVVYDLFDNLPDFIEGRTPWPEVLKYYVFLMPSALIYIVPVSLLLATLYSLSSLTRHNELTAMRASGVSIYRLLLPYMGVGVVVSVLLLVVNETVGPWSTYWCHQFVRAQKHRGKINVHIAYNLAYKSESGNRIWQIEQFNTRTHEMKNVQVLQQRPDGTDQYKIWAQRAEWLDRRWWFSDVKIQRYDAQSRPTGPPESCPWMEMSDFTETPVQFLNEVRDPEFLSAADLLNYIRTHRNLSEQTIRRIRVDVHHRLSSPWTCIVVTLLGISFGVHTGRRGALSGIGLCFALFFSYYLLVNLFLAFGKKGLIPAWLGGWGPNIFYMVLSFALLRRIR